jgi:hypothetical protein
MEARKEEKRIISEENENSFPLFSPFNEGRMRQAFV